MRRSSGVLMHITSLPSPYGIGGMGREAFAFIDFLAVAGQSHWQILPVGPTGYGDSPYQSFSTFAGNPYLIDLTLLLEEGLITKRELMAVPYGADSRAVDFGAIYGHRAHVLRAAFMRGRELPIREEAAAFAEREAAWLWDYALFMSLKGHFGMNPWLDWEEDIRFRKAEAMRRYEMLLREEIDYHRFVQYLFFRQWEALKAYANGKGIGLIGDLPIYVSLDSADVWATPELFMLDGALRPIYVGGVPPDYFSQTGQLWGNPLYHWERHAGEGYGWWIRRIGQAARLFDMLRIDHFRGFCDYWRIPSGKEAAIHGEWAEGPGMGLIEALRSAYPAYPIIAEDLGLLTEAVHALRRKSGFPGMKVLQFAFDESRRSIYLPHEYEKDCICYTGTHDNETVPGFFKRGNPLEVAFAVEYCGLHEREGLHWGFIRVGMASMADLFIMQMQDVLGSEFRMNTPGTVFGNWRWRMLPEEATDALAVRLKSYTRMYGR